MSNKNNILFIIEGTKENNVLNLLKGFVFSDRYHIVYRFGTNIYKLYRKLSVDEDLDIFFALKEMDREGIFDGYDRDSFSEIYLFFDYDAHVPMPYMNEHKIIGDDTIRLMLDFFDNETVHGKLFLSYPMLEALQHFKSNDEKWFKELTVKCKGENCPTRDTCPDKEECKNRPGYKTVVNADSPHYSSLGKFNEKTWKTLTNAHLCKLNYLMEDSYVFPTSRYEQSDIFDCQYKKYISQPCPVVAVLSAIPIFILDYLGVEETSRRFR